MIYVIGGPTGSGKSSLAVSLRKRWGAPILNADAFQMYRGMDIGTNKETSLYGDNLPYLFDYLSPSTPTTVAQYQQEARPILKQLLQTHPKVIIVGGTGLYIKALLYDFTFPPHQQTADLSSFESLSDEALHAYLQTIDRPTSEKIHAHNRRRVLRAIAIYLQTGQTKSTQEALQKRQTLYEVQFVGIDLPRQELYDRIEARVERMFHQGLVAEVSQLMRDHDRQSHAFQAIGYKEVIAHLNGQMSLAEVKAAIKQATTRYAKRQLTYFRHQFPMVWYPTGQAALEALSK